MVVSQQRGVIFSAFARTMDNKISINDALKDFENRTDLTYSSDNYEYKGDFGLVVFRVDKGSILGLFREHVLPISFVFIITFVIIPSLFSFSLLFNLRYAFNELEKAAQNIAGGKFNFMLSRKKNDELSQVYDSFNEMKNTLKETRDRNSRLLMAVSHDLKTPLTSMKGYLEAFQDGVIKKEDEMKYFQTIIKKSALLEDRIQTLIDFAKVETEEWKTTFEVHNAGEILRDLSLCFYEDALIYKRNFSWDLKDLEESWFLCDARLFTRALENLLENAKRYTEEEGSISLEASVERDMLKILIRDDGYGIEKNDLPFIFEPFYRGDKGRNRKGMGMGLYSVKSIIHAHRGLITCSSTKGEGAEFYIRVPLISIQPEQTL